MAMGRDSEVQPDLMMTWAEIPRSPGHVFFDRLQKLLQEGGFDHFVEETCKAYYAPRMGAPSVPPGRYFRMLLIGYFEGIPSERGIVWRSSDSLSLREFLRLSSRENGPDHSWMSKTRSRLPHEVHDKIFGWVLALVAGHDLVKGDRIGVDGSTMEANAALGTKATIPARCASISMAMSGRRAYRSRHRPMAICAGMATRKPKRQSMPIAPV